jgi:CHAD domain-containing protein
MNPHDIRALVSARAEDFFDQLPGIRDGRPDSVHDARVACRRLRELLPLLADDRRAAHAERVLVDAGGQLGRVRDLDVMISILNEKEEAVPVAALAIASARRALRVRLMDERRALVKKLEDLELGRIAVFRKHKRRSARRLIRRLLPHANGSDAMLRDRIGLRAHRLRTAIVDSAGLYFPNRLHSTRKAMKKLRYVVEAADDLRIWSPPHLLGDLRKAQDILGGLRDAAVLRESVGSLPDSSVPEQEHTALLTALDADVVRAHESYLDRRGRLLAIVDACDRFVVRTSRSHKAVHSVLTLVRKAG